MQCRVLSTSTTPTSDQGKDKDKGKEKGKDKMQFVNVSLRPSRVATDDAGSNDNDDGNGDASSSLEVGALVSAFVANISLAKGCFLRLPGGGTGQVHSLMPSNEHMQLAIILMLYCPVAYTSHKQPTFGHYLQCP